MAIELAESKKAAEAKRPTSKTIVPLKEAVKSKKSAGKNTANAPVKEPAKGDDRVPNGMVRITHNPLTNSAVITPLYGPLEPTPSYLQQPIPHAITSQALQNNPVNYRVPSPVVQPPINPSSITPTNPTATAKSSLSDPTTTSGQPQQMVTIRRVMQPNLSEPVVTVTLKGESPGNDRVLFTLVNGQVLPTDGKNAPVASTVTPATAAPTGMTKKKLKKKEKKKEKREEKLRLLNEAASYSASSSAPVFQPILRPPVIS